MKENDPDVEHSSERTWARAGELDSEEPLTGGFLTASVTRSGDTVRRDAGPWSATVHTWLRHLADNAPDIAPKPIRLDPANGVELVSYIPGTALAGGASPPYLWCDDTLTTLARLIRRFHDAAESFQAPPAAVWQQTAAYPSGGEVICHNDLAPWNTVFRNERPAAFIDWDLAAPGPRLWDVAYALWHFVPLYGDSDSDPFDVDVFEPRARRARFFCDTYGLEDRGAVFDMIIRREQAVYAAIKSAADEGDPAYVRLWEMGAGDGIQRQIAYAQRHRNQLEQALA